MAQSSVDGALAVGHGAVRVRLVAGVGQQFGRVDAAEFPARRHAVALEPAPERRRERTPFDLPEFGHADFRGISFERGAHRRQ